jgi:hypothetical protein
MKTITTRCKLTYQEYLAEMSRIKVTCAKCGRKDAELSPMGLLCLTCTFGEPLPKGANP